MPVMSCGQLSVEMERRTVLPKLLKPSEYASRAKPKQMTNH